jgi:putative ABC transport system permease protein
MENWSNTWIPSYIELKEGASLASLDKAIDHLIQANAPENIKTTLKIHPIPLTQYYVEKDNGLVKRMLYTLSLVALFILLMAVVNFINITISSAGNRMREIGVRKVLGGLKMQLVMQFLAESLILVLIATVLAVVVYPVTKPFFEEIVGKQIPALTAFPIYFSAIPLVVVLLVGILAGAYPAFVLSSINTLSSLKGKLKTVKENVVLRKSLVGFQFAMALIVLIAATVVTQQVAHFFSRSLGYDKEFVVSSQVPRDWTPAGVQKMETIRNEFASMPEVSSVSLSYEIPNGNNGGQQPLYKAGGDSTRAIPTQLLLTDEKYLSTYQIPLKAGEFFDNRNFDSAKLVVNENAVAALGIKNAGEAIGQQVRMPGQPTVFTIKGVVNDFHFFLCKTPCRQ